MCQVHKLKIQGHLCMKKSQSTFFTPPPHQKKKNICIGQSHSVIYSSQNSAKLTNLLSNLIMQYRTIDITDIFTVLNLPRA